MLSCGLEQRLRLIMTMEYNNPGELELFSLHRIKNRINSMKIHPKVKEKLRGELIRENSEYRANSDNNWMCITPTSLDRAVDKTIDYLVGQTSLGLATVDDTKIREALERVMSRQVEDQSNVIKKWFVDNYENILYNMNGKIPFPIVRKMREQLSQWAIQHTNPFMQPIEELIEETATSLGLNPGSYDSHEDLWEELKKYR